MNFLSTHPEFVGGFLLLIITLVTSAAGWWIKNLVAEKDALADRLEQVELKYVTEDEIRRLEYRMEGKLDGFCVRITSLDHRMTERLDKVLEHLANRRGA